MKTKISISLMKMSVFYLITVFMAISVSALEKSENLVSNPGFEEGLDKWGSIENFGKWEFIADLQEPNVGKASARLKCLSKATDKENPPAYLGGAWGRLVQVIKVDPSKKYRFSCWAKTTGDASAVIFIAPCKVEATRTSQAKTAGIWKNINIEEISPAKEEIVIYLNQFGGGSSWFDNVELLENKESPNNPH
jgi:hypothetical protein